MIYGKVTDRRRTLLFAVVEQFEPEERENIASALEKFATALGLAVADLSQQID
jgi:hypothetical protein